MKSPTKGFTLIELLVTISIIGVLSGVVLFATSAVRDRNQDATVKANLKTIQIKAEQWYYASGHNNKYNIGGGSTPVSGNCYSPAQSPLKSPSRPPTKYTFLGFGGGVASNPDSTIHDILQTVYDASDKTHDPICVVLADGSAYAIAFPLHDGGAWCIDSKGTFEKVASVDAALSSDTDTDCGL